MFDKLRRNLRDLGPANTALYLLNRLLAAASGGRAHVYRYLLVAQPISGSVAPLRPDSRVRIEPAGPDHPLSGSFPRPAEVIRQRFDSGAQCLLASHTGTFAGYIWWQKQRYDEDEVRCRFVLADPQTSVWDFDVYVEPHFRLGRMMARLWDDAARRWHADGVHWSFSRISAFNAASITAHTRLGLKRVGSAVFVVLGRWQLSLFSGRPFVHVGFGSDACPSVLLRPPR